MERSRPRPVAWDSSAAIYYFERVSPYYGLLARQFRELRGSSGTIILSVVAYHELLVGPWRDGNRRAVSRLVRLCRRPPVALAPVTPAVARISARLRAATGLSTPDSLIIATARTLRCTEIVGNDRQWRQCPLGLPFRYLGGPGGPAGER